MRPKLILTLAMLAALASYPALAGGKDRTVSDPNHMQDGTMLDKEMRDNNKQVNHDAAKFGEPSGSEDGGWIDGNTAKAPPQANLGK